MCMRGEIGRITLKKEQEQAVIAPLTADRYFIFSSCSKQASLAQNHSSHLANETGLLGKII